LSALFLDYVPGIDLWAAAFFYREEQGFFLGQHPVVLFVYEAVPVMTWICVLGFPLLILINALSARLTKGSGPFFCSNRVLLYLSLTLALGPGLFSWTLQDQWGRARPREVTEFGGDKQFTSALTLSKQCESNCSFVSSHAAVGFYFVALSFVVRRYRRAIVAGSLFLGAGVGLARMAQGSHFLSDVIFSAVLTYMVAYLLSLLFMTDRGNHGTEK
jgi:lipid A 4'-phosphatase